MIESLFLTKSGRISTILGNMTMTKKDLPKGNTFI